MFINSLGNPTPLKKAVYLLATTVLGVLFSSITHTLIEINYLNWMGSQDRLIVFYGNCALPPTFQIWLLGLGVVGGFLLGRYWWKKVYVEKVWLKK